MLVLWIIIGLLAGAFGATLLYGAPYLPTRRKQIDQALVLLNLQPGQIFYDLGCGDGRLLRAAAGKGAVAIGYELNPFLFLIAYVWALPHRKKIQVRFGNFWQSDISDADAVFVFLMQKYMDKFDKFMKSQNFKNPVKLVSYAFKIPNRKPSKRRGAVYLYRY